PHDLVGEHRPGVRRDRVPRRARRRSARGSLLQRLQHLGYARPGEAGPGSRHGGRLPGTRRPDRRGGLPDAHRYRCTGPGRDARGVRQGGGAQPQGARIGARRLREPVAPLPGAHAGSRRAPGAPLRRGRPCLPGGRAARAPGRHHALGHHRRRQLDTGIPEPAGLAAALRRRFRRQAGFLRVRGRPADGGRGVSAMGAPATSRDGNGRSPEAIPHVDVLEDVSFERFHGEIRPAGRPVLLKGAVLGWPAVQAGRTSAEAAVAYLKGFDRGHPVETILGRPEIEGRFFYNERLDGLNFARMPERIGVTLERILNARNDPRPPSFYIQSASIPDYLPGFAQANWLPLPDPPVAPRIWVGNRITVQAHFDLSENLACCVAGRRRFTLFPPEQTPNLYPGPFELTLAGPPVSMVRLDAPDLERHPN